MSGEMPDAKLREFAAFVAERTGLYFPREKHPDLELALKRAAPELGFPGAAACVETLLASPPDKELLETLAGYLTVGETYFFRNKADFGALGNIIFPALAAARAGGESVRVWSAGCATGEEPYSLAMLLDRSFPELKGRNVSILATDINSRALRQAGRGVYGDWSFREVPRDIKEIYFTKHRGGGLALLPRIKEMVAFSYLNLVEDSYPSLLTATNAMDLILCRNVLMYFRQDLAEAVLRKFHASLREGGWLLLGPAEGPLTFPDLVPGLKAAQLPGLTVYRKLVGKEPAPSFAPPVPVPAPAAEPAAVLMAAPPARAAEPEKRPLEEAAALYGAGLYTGAGEKPVALPATETGNAAALLLLAREQAGLGRLAEAAELCAKAIAADKFAPGANYLLGSIFLEEGRLDEAARSFRRALYLAPDHAPAHLALGNLFLREGKTGRASGHFRNAAALLERYGPDELPPDSEGMSAGRLGELARAALARCADD
ncbi:MAG: tetratricopeptide repeat protein [Elusimicrobia bacterium]|nr:tetratricopeptide repeat protein [Elusimicrobiota bacterium]